MPGTIAYLMSRFPRLTESFILREMEELADQGWDIRVYPLIVERPSVMHAEAVPWMSRVQSSPFVSRAVLAANWQAWQRKPHYYWSLLARTIGENRTDAKFLSRALALFPKAVHTARQMQAQGIRHIHAHFASHPALEAWLIHRLAGIPYSVTVHAHDIFVRREMLATKLRDAAFVVAISEYNLDYLARVLGPWIRAKTHVIHCGIEPHKYQVRVPAHRQRFEILSVGSLEPYKGHVFLIQACAKLRERGIPVYCRIIGGGSERPALKRLIARERLEAVVELTGPQAQGAVAQLLPTADCYVQPSIVTSSGKMEGLPVSIMEAMACQVPVVATAISGIPELVYPGETGCLVPPGDVSALADALAAIYTDPKPAVRRAQCARERVLADFDIRKNSRALGQLFENVLQQDPASHVEVTRSHREWN